MPTLRPTDANDCIKLIGRQRDDIINGVYDIEIDKGWLNTLSEQDQSFLATYSRISRRKIALYSNSTNVLERLAKDPNSEVRWEIANNPNAPEDVLTNLSGAREESIRTAVAQNPYTPWSILLLMSKDSSKEVRKAVGENSQASELIFDMLVEDTEKEVRTSIAKNTKTQTQFLDKLAKDKDEIVRHAVAKNPNTPLGILDLLSKDDCSSVRVAANQNLENRKKKGMCYIATACYGSLECEEVISLRAFRDDYLSQRIWGRVLIKIYYTFSPRVAKWLTDKKILTAFIKQQILDRIVVRIKRHYRRPFEQPV